LIFLNQLIVSASAFAIIDFSGYASGTLSGYILSPETIISHF
jgi:hypothetical protein